MWKRLHVKYRLFFSDFNETSIFSTYIRKKKIPNFIEIRPVGTELFHAGGRTDRCDEVNYRCSQFRERA